MSSTDNRIAKANQILGRAVRKAGILAHHNSCVASQWQCKFTTPTNKTKPH